MALSTPTLLDATTATNFSEEFVTSGSVSPTGGALLIVSWMNRLGTDTDDALATSITDTLTGTGTWTIHQQQRTYSDESILVGIATAQAGATPGTGTITVNFTDGGNRKIIHVHEATGHDTTTPVPQSAKNGDTAASSLTVTLSGTPASTSMVFGSFAHNEEGGALDITPGTGFTETAESTISTLYELQSQYDLTNADTTCDWTGLDTTAASEESGVAIEIAEASAGGSDIKTVDTIAIANVKTISGIAIANVKTRDGISNV